MPIDPLLVARVRDGDEEAFERLFFNYAQGLIHFATCLLGGIHQAENCVQEVFLAVWKNRQSLNPDRNIKTYLFMAVKNRALKEIRHMEVVRKGEASIKRSLPLVSTPEEIFREREFSFAVNDAIQGLPEKSRTLFSE